MADLVKVAAVAGAAYATSGASLAATGAASGAAAGAAGTAAGAAGGMSLLQGATLGMGLLGTYQGAQQQKYAADVQAEGIKAQAYQEKLRAGEEANLRRERLLKALAAQNVYGGASGLSGGSAEALQLQSVGEFRKEQQGADVMAGLSQSNAEREAAGISKAGRYARTGSLLKMGTQLASIG